MNERIKQIRQALNMYQKDFACKIGLQQTSLSDIENGKIIVTERTIILVCSVFNVNEQWLRFGEGEMFNNLEKNYTEFFEIYQQFSTPLQEFLNQTAKALLDTQEKLKGE